MSENTCAPGLLDGRTHSVRGSDWQANSLSALSRSPYIRTHEMCGVPRGTPAGLGTGFAHVDVSATARMTTVTRYLRMMRPLDFTVRARCTAPQSDSDDGVPGLPLIVLALTTRRLVDRLATAVKR